MDLAHLSDQLGVGQLRTADGPAACWRSAPAVERLAAHFGHLARRGRRESFGLPGSHPHYSGSLSRLLHPEGRRSFEQLTLHLQLGAAPPQPGQLGALLSGQTRLLAAVDAGLTHPVAQVRLTDPQIPGHMGHRLRSPSNTSATASALNSFVNRRLVLPDGLLCSITFMVTS